MKIAGSPVYLDTSGLAKLYVPEPQSVELETALVGRRDLIVSDLAITELTSALLRRVRDGDLAVSHGRRIYRQLLADLQAGEFRRADLGSAAHREAERLLMSVGRTVALRAGDALHLALANAAGARTLVTFDRRLTAAAEAIGTFELIGT